MDDDLTHEDISVEDDHGAAFAGLFAFALFMCAARPVPAHHAFAAEFDVNKPTKLEGTLKEWEMINPHSWFHVEVKEADGKTIFTEGNGETTACAACHTTQAHWRDKRVVRSWGDLVYQVTRWQQVVEIEPDVPAICAVARSGLARRSSARTVFPLRAHDRRGRCRDAGSGGQPLAGLRRSCPD